MTSDHAITIAIVTWKENTASGSLKILPISTAIDPASYPIQRASRRLETVKKKHWPARVECHAKQTRKRI